MTENAIFHESDSRYCFATDKNKITLRLRIARGDRPDSIEVIYGGKYEFSRERLTKKMNIIARDRLFTYYGCTLLLTDVRLAYVFKIIENEKDLYYSEDGLTEDYDFEYNFYNCFQYSYPNEIDIHYAPKGVEKLVFYQIFVDRFKIGSDDKPYVNIKWGDKPTPKSFAGGDLYGIKDGIDYIRSLGVNCLYLTPIFKSPSNHKYDIEDYYTVDPMFGGECALRALVEAAHEKRLRVVLDAVFNHVSENHSFFKDVINNGEASKYKDFFIIKDYSPFEYECFSSCKYMPKFNTSNSACAQYLIDAAKHWTRELSIDGWRLDVSDEVSHAFWRDFRKEIKSINPNCLLIGENWHNANNYLQGDQFDGIMNYALTKACIDFFVSEKLTSKEMCDKLYELLMRNSDTANKMMLNLIDSHDTHRFLTLVDGKTERLMSAIALIFFYPGMPCIYYGTENMMHGGYDPDSRRCFIWEETEIDNPVKSLIRFLTTVKKKPEFNAGEFYSRTEGALLVLGRRSEKSEYRLVINSGQTAEYKTEHLLAASGEMFGIINPYGFVIESTDS